MRIWLLWCLIRSERFALVVIATSAGRGPVEDESWVASDGQVDLGKRPIRLVDAHVRHDPRVRRCLFLNEETNSKAILWYCKLQ